jgi:pimeloyl-ACP methyl ester carboxylesterase
MVYIRRRMSTRAMPEPTPELIRSRVRTLPKRFREASADGLAAEWELRVADQAFTVSVADHLCSVRDGPASNPNTVITAQPDVWIAMDEGKVTGGRAFFEDRLAVRGNLDLAVRFQTLFRPFRRARKPADLDQLEVTLAGQRLSTYVMGSGPPLLLLHGLGAFKVTWVPLLSTFASNHRVIVPDLPGHGGSGKPNAEYTPRFFANAMLRLMDELGVERAAVVGNSLGGRVALELALRNPSRVAALALLDPALPGFRWRSIAAFTRVIPTELMAFPVPLRERWMELAIRQLFARPGSLPREVHAVAAREFVRIYREAAARMAFLSALRHLVIERPDPFFASLHRVKQPALVIFGERDRLVPPRLGVRLVQQLPDAQLVVLPGVGHVPQIEAMDETLEHVTSFLASAPRGSSRG